MVAACLGAGGAAALADAARAQKTAVLSDDNDGSDAAAAPKAGIRTVLVDVTKDDDVARLKAVVEARYPRGIQYAFAIQGGTQGGTQGVAQGGPQGGTQGG